MVSLANPRRFLTVTDPLWRPLGVLAVALLGFGLYMALFSSPADYQQRETVRIMYVHVPAAWMAMAVYAFIAGASFITLIWRHSLADVAARVAVPAGTVFTGLALLTGMLWGRPMWGTWWVWDARLTSVLILFFLYLGLQALRAAIDDEVRASRLCAVLALVGALNLPIIKFSVDWWNTLHQGASVLRMDGPTIHASMLTPLLVMALGYAALFAFVLMVRMRSEILRRTRAGARRRAPSSAVFEEAPANV